MKALRRISIGYFWRAAFWVLVGVGVSFTAPGQTLSTILTNGPSDRRINLVVLSEGYTSSQLAQFRTDATNLVAQILAAAPFNQYRSCFNAFAISVASAESGSDHPSQEILRNTYFNASYEAYFNPYFITIPPDEFDPDPNHGLGRVTNLLNSLMPQCDVPVLLVNDPSYGGSGGSVLICSTSPGIETLMVHEMGHTLADLADEYADAWPGYIPTEAANATQETRPNFIKWKNWIATNTPLPTPQTDTYANTVGLFEGANYTPTGWYRPRLNCLMRDLAAPYCEICQEALVLSLYRKVRPIERWIPTATNLVSGIPQTLTFAVTNVPAPAGLPVAQWSVDNVAVARATQTVFQVLSSSLSNGLHTVKVDVRDATPLVRTDPSQRLRQTQTWQLQVDIPNLRLKAFRPTLTNNFSVLVTGYASHGIVLQTSTNLSAWQSVVTNAFTSGTFFYAEPTSAKTAKRYYRALGLP